MRWIAVVALAACNGPSGRAQLADGSGTDPSSSAGASSGLVWVDASGAEVPGVFYGAGGALSYLDGNGITWWLSVWETTPDLAFQPSRLGPGLFYSDKDCADPWAGLDFFPYPPGMAIALDLPGEISGSFPDIVTLPRSPRQHVDAPYTFDGANCVVQSPGDQTDGFPLSSLIAVDRPELTWAPPLHAEWR